MRHTLRAYVDAVRANSVDTYAVLQEYIQAAKDDSTNTRLRVHDTHVLSQTLDPTSLLGGAPIAIKDNIMTEGLETTGGSQILQGYRPPYSASCIDKLRTSGGVTLGKVNMDEFAMGSSTEYSSYGVTGNPYDHSRIAGGSSGGSAAVVANDQCLGALGTETGGSVRQPAALCGVVGVKPSYGRVSRYGVQAMASSLDQVGTFGKTVEDSMLLLQAIAGHDGADATSVDRGDEPQQRTTDIQRSSLAGMKCAVPREYLSSEGLDPRIRQSCLETIDLMRSLGAEIEEIDIPLLKYVIPLYYVIVPAEVSTNMARFDGIRYGLQRDTLDYDDIFAYYASIRHDGFGDEVKRRIMLGSYVLSAGHYDAYYHKAQQVRQLLKRTFDNIFADYDAILGPTTPSLARKVGQKGNDPVQMYLEDVYTAAANLLGCPAISVPTHLIQEDGVSLPVGFHIMTQRRDEGTMFALAQQIETHSNFVRSDLYLHS